MTGIAGHDPGISGHVRPESLVTLLRNTHDVVPTLAHVRRLLPPRTLIWAGGAGLSEVKRVPKGVRVMTHFDEAIAALGDLVRDGQLG